MAAYIFIGMIAGFLVGQCLLWLGGKLVSEERAEFLFWFCHIYPVFWFGVGGFIAAWSIGDGMQKVRIGLYWVGLWHFLLLCFISGGALTGALLFLVVGTLAGMDYSATEMLISGAKNGGFYLLIWSPGIAMILCFMKAYKGSEVSAE